MWKMTVPDCFQYGLLFEPTIGSVERYAISTGVIVNMLGGFLTAEDTTLGNINTTLRVQYIEIPATIKLRTNEINYFTYWRVCSASTSA